MHNFRDFVLRVRNRFSLFQVKLLPQIAIDNGLKMLDTCFEKHRVNLDPSSSHSETTVYRSIDKFMNVLPHLIGSDKWKEKWHVGLMDSDVVSHAGSEQPPESLEVPSSSMRLDVDAMIPGSSTLTSRHASMDSLAKSQSSIGDQMVINKPIGLFDEDEDEDNQLKPNLAVNSFFRPQADQRKIVNLFDDEPPSMDPSPLSARKPVNLFDDYGSVDSLPVETEKIVEPQQPVDLFNDNDFEDFIKKIEKKQENVTVAREITQPQTSNTPAKTSGDKMKHDMRKLGEEIKNVQLKKAQEVPKTVSKGVENVRVMDTKPAEAYKPKSQDSKSVTPVKSVNSVPQIIKTPEIQSQAKPKKITNLFDDDDDDQDFFAEIIKQKAAKKASEIPKITAKKSSNLFDDDEEDESTVELFKSSSGVEVTKVKRENEGKLINEQKLTNKDKLSSLAEKLPIEVNKSSVGQKKSSAQSKKSSLFDDSDDEISEVTQSASKTPSKNSTKLFGDDSESENDENLLFAPKNNEIMKKPTISRNSSSFVEKKQENWIEKESSMSDVRKTNESSKKLSKNLENPMNKQENLRLSQEKLEKNQEIQEKIQQFVAKNQEHHENFENPEKIKEMSKNSHQDSKDFQKSIKTYQETSAKDSENSKFSFEKLQSFQETSQNNSKNPSTPLTDPISPSNLPDNQLNSSENSQLDFNNSEFSSQETSKSDQTSSKTSPSDEKSSNSSSAFDNSSEASPDSDPKSLSFQAEKSKIEPEFSIPNPKLQPDEETSSKTVENVTTTIETPSEFLSNIEKTFNSTLPFLSDEPPEDDTWNTEDIYEDSDSKPFTSFATNSSTYSSVPVFDDIPPEDNFVSSSKPPVPAPNFYSDDDAEEFENIAKPKEEKTTRGKRENEKQPKADVASTDHQVAVVMDETDKSVTTSDVKSKLDLFTKKVEDLPVKKAMPGKLNMNLKINVGALMPGARIPVKSVQEPVTNFKEVKSDPSTSTSSKETPGLLNNESLKSRAKIQVKRRPSTRRGRQENYQRTLSQIEGEEIQDCDSWDFHKPLSIKNLAPSIFDDFDDEIISENQQSNNEQRIQSIPKVVTTNKISVFYDDEEDTRKMLEEKKSRQEEDKKKLGRKQAEVTKTAQVSEASAGIASKLGLFDDDSDDDLFGGKKKSADVKKSIVAEKTKPKLLFDDDEEDNLFGKPAKKASTLKKTDKLFESDDEGEAKGSTILSKHKTTPATQPKKQSLFGDDDSDDGDLFSSKPKCKFLRIFKLLNLFKLTSEISEK